MTGVDHLALLALALAFKRIAKAAGFGRLLRHQGRVFCLAADANEIVHPAPTLQGVI